MLFFSFSTLLSGEYSYLRDSFFVTMILKRLSILNYKNIGQADLEFSPGVNCFIGQNGMGKTNLLDAIYYLSFCKSATNPSTRR